MNQATSFCLGFGAGVGLLAPAILRRNRRIGLRDQVVWITGGSRGLGLEMARVLAGQGARLALVSRTAEQLERASQELGGVYTEVCDVTDPEQVRATAANIRREVGPIDILINNAGIITSGPFEEMTEDDFESALKTHFWAALHCIQAVLPDMRKRSGGRIVNVASIAGRISVPHLLPYSASKFALVGLSEGLRAELAKDGILVTTVCPGLMRTGSHPNANFKGQHRQEYALFSLAASNPLSSMDSSRAARQIVDACQHGDAQIVLSPQAKLGALLHGLLPGLTADIFGVVNRLLPGPGGIGTRKLKGWDSQSALSPSALTQPGDSATERNNEA